MDDVGCALARHRLKKTPRATCGALRAMTLRHSYAVHLLDRAAEFCQAMKARITGRFLAVRAFVSGRPNTAGPP